MKKKILKDFVLTEISGVDRPAQPTAKMTIMKRADFNSELHEEVIKYYDPSKGAKDFNSILIENEKQKRLWEAKEELYPLFEAMQSSISSIVLDDKLSETDRQARIETSVSDFLSAVRDVMPEVEEELMKTFQELNKAGLSTGETVEENMTAEVEKKLAELEKALAEKNVELEKAYKDMAEMKAMEEKKKKEMEMKKNDETVEVSGQLISKSAVGDETFAVFKAQAEAIAKAEERIAKAEEAAEMAKLEKRASEEFKHIPGTAADVAKMLKALGGMEEDVAKSFESVLKSVDEKNAEAFKTIGFSKSNREVTKSFEAAVAEVQKRENVSKTRAMEIAAQENPDLVNEIR